MIPKLTFTLGGAIILASILALGFELGAQTKTGAGKIKKLIDVGGYRLYINCAGKGSPTVVMDAGGYDTSDTWNKVQPEIAKFTRVCVYDRADYGKSEHQPSASYTCREMVKDLHTLLINAGIAAPFVLVGHSFGGMNVRLYASQYPKEVVGMVLVDSVHEDEMPRWIALIPPEIMKQISPEKRGDGLELNQSQIRTANWHSNIPLIVLSSGDGDPNKFDPNSLNPIIRPLAAQEKQLRVEMQKALAALSSNSKHIWATNSGHYIQHDQPELVINSVRQVAEATQTQRLKR